MATNSALSLSVSPDQSMLLPNWGTPTRVIRTALDGGGLRADWPAVNTPTGRDNCDSCFAAAGDRLYTADQRSDQFVGISVTTSQIIQRLQASSYVDALLCVWNGLVISGSDDYYSMIDVHVFDGPSGLELTTLNSDGTTYFGHYRDLLHHGLVVSGDGTRLVSAWNGSQQQIASGMYIQSLPTPP